MNKCQKCGAKGATECEEVLDFEMQYINRDNISFRNRMNDLHAPAKPWYSFNRPKRKDHLQRLTVGASILCANCQAFFRAWLKASGANPSEPPMPPTPPHKNSWLRGYM